MNAVQIDLPINQQNIVRQRFERWMTMLVNANVFLIRPSVNIERQIYIGMYIF